LRAVAALGIAVLVAAYEYFAFSPGRQGLDFRAFYCGARTEARGGDPYRAEPLRSCEQAVSSAHDMPAVVALPSPVPPYVNFALAPLAALPYPAALALWLLLLDGCILITVLALRRLSGAPWIVLAAVLGLGEKWALDLGELVPIFVAASAAAALLLRARRPRLAALALVPAFVEPNLALPLAVAFLLFAPRGRFACIAAGAAVASASVYYGGGLNVEYLRGVLPAHILGETGNLDQLSLTGLMHELGAGDVLALRAGQISYALMLILGVAAARLLSEERRDPALAVLIPPAFVLLGGPFIHVTQMTAALPALLILVFRVPEGARWYGAALALLAIPWLVQFEGDKNVAGVALIIYAVWFAVTQRKRESGVVAALAGAAFFAVVGAEHVLGKPQNGPALAAAAAGALAGADRLAEDSWRAFVDASWKPGGLALTLLWRFPTWIGMVIFVGAALREALAAPVRVISHASYAP
jgi:hypothetical protein